ncbi:uncharacterized protein [Elaeis guineensis]|uniref:Uncharacterized protein LOC105049413 n=1 Tax=Elaeis guineensis var. tenera TaxID=51953 RepID=A0A6I9RRT5_ELAGV|nr:uncharacterized protein LOC105049413 [Elaeis guineensis]
MKPAMRVVSLLLLLLLATTTQGIRLDAESLAAFHNNIHEKGSSMGGVNKVGVAPCGINGQYSSGRSRKLMNKRMVALKNERSKGTVFDAARSHRYSKEDVGRNGEDGLHVEPPVSKQPQSLPDMLEIAGMDYSPAKRVPPIHN